MSDEAEYRWAWESGQRRIAEVESQNQALQEGVRLGLNFIRGEYDTPSYGEVVEQLTQLQSAHPGD